jgi:hypothetical protein
LCVHRASDMAAAPLPFTARRIVGRLQRRGAKNRMKRN